MTSISIHDVELDVCLRIVLEIRGIKGASLLLSKIIHGFSERDAEGLLVHPARKPPSIKTVTPRNPTRLALLKTVLNPLLLGKVFLLMTHVTLRDVQKSPVGQAFSTSLWPGTGNTQRISRLLIAQTPSFS